MQSQICVVWLQGKLIRGISWPNVKSWSDKIVFKCSWKRSWERPWSSAGLGKLFLKNDLTTVKLLCWTVEVWADRTTRSPCRAVQRNLGIEYAKETKTNLLLRCSKVVLNSAHCTFSHETRYIPSIGILLVDRAAAFQPKNLLFD